MGVTDAAPPQYGQYQLIDKIAQGGMAEIFRGKAMDLHGIERPVVIKRILPHIAASPEFVEMLIDEAKIAVMLSHGNIAQIYDLGKVADDYFIVMEYVEGKTVSQIMKRMRTEGAQMPAAIAAYLCSEVANGLDYMHRKTDEHGTPLHIVHRDISPQNIILSTAGTVKIIDFGIAKAKTKISITDSGILKGKFAYMSPEHAEGEKLDSRTDLFSLGIILFELLTGQRLFKGKNNAETIRKVKKTRVPPPSGFRRHIPRSLDEIVLKALERDRKKRYQSAHALSQDLVKFMVNHEPDFSPRELIPYLQGLFPELVPNDIRPQEETPISPLKIVTEKEERDETVAADSAVIRAKLKESLVFHVPEKEISSSVIHKKGRNGEGKKEEGTERICLRRRRTAALLLAAVILSFGGLYGAARLYLSFKNRLLPKASPPALSAITPMETKLPANLPTAEPQPPPAPIAPAYGSLKIESVPAGASIFLNDVDSNQKTPALLDRLPTGEIEIGLHFERYKFREERVSIKAGETSSLSIPLEPNVGDLEINSLPPGAEVTLNGTVAGKTPFLLSNLPPGSAYDIVLKQAGFETWQGRVKVFGGKREVVNRTLRKLPLD